MKYKLYWSIFLSHIFRPPSTLVVINFVQFILNKVLKNSKLKYTPVSLVISATKRCNFTCEFCFVEDYMNASVKHEGDLTEDQLNEILKSDFGKRALRVGFLGGEPFLNKDIFKFIEIVSYNRKICTIVTNSSPLKNEILVKLLSSPLDALGLSLYENNYEDVKRVAVALNNKKAYWIQTVISNTTISKMESIIVFCLSIGCNKLIFDNYYPKTKNRIDLVVFDDNTDYIRQKEILKKRYKNKIDITWVPLVSRKDPILKKCLLPFSYVQIDNEGIMGPCCVRAPESKYGSIFDENSWNKNEIVEIRNSLLKADLKVHPDCRYCQCLSDDLYNI